MAEHPHICLRYFDARARAQFLRAYLHVRDIDFDDERIPLDEGFTSWLAIRDDRARTGPLQRLPVLQYGDELIPETFVIAGFVHEKFGDAARLTKAQNLQHDVLVSCANVDLMLQTALLIWGDLAFPGVDMPAFLQNALNRINRTYDVIERSLSEWGWVDGMRERPVTVADCFLWEELDQAATLFGSHFSLADRPELERFRDEHPAADRFRQLLAERPCQITGRPGEAAAIENIRALLASAPSAS